MQQAKYHGSCLCGAVQYELLDDFNDIIQCHCQKCRKATGTASATNAPVHKDTFKLLEGAAQLKAFASSANAKRYFCGECGSPVYSVKDTAPEIYRIRIGLIDEDIPHRIAKHVFVGSKANWDQILDDAAQFEDFPST